MKWIAILVLAVCSSAADLNPNGKEATKWPKVSDGLLTRARQNWKIET